MKLAIVGFRACRGWSALTCRIPDTRSPSTRRTTWGAAAAAGSLRLAHVEDITPHYAKTLALWRGRLLENAPSARALGYDTGFLRLWDFYLAACEACFAERYTGDLQLVFAKPGNRREPILGGLARPN